MEILRVAKIIWKVKTAKDVRNFLWELPQNLLGLLLIHTTKAWYSVAWKDCYFTKKIKGVYSLGRFIVLSNEFYNSVFVIKAAREYGDLSENSEYDEAKNEQALLDSKIEEVEALIRNAKIIDNISTKSISVGVSVKLFDYEFDEEVARRINKKIAKNQFDFNDFLSQLEQIKKMGNIKDLASMIPGVGKALKNVDIDDNAFKGVEAIIYSMTKEERANPQLLNGSRRNRIAAGSGTSIQEVNRLLKQFDEMRKMMRYVQKNPFKRR